MTVSLQTIDRISPTRRPAEKAIGYLRWTDLLFLHWRNSAKQIEPLLPPLDARYAGGGRLGRFGSVLYVGRETLVVVCAGSLPIFARPTSGPMCI